MSELDRVALDFRQWHQSKFGLSHPLGQKFARKLLLEATEFEEDPSLEEAADVMFCVFGWLDDTGHTLDDLVDAMDVKLIKNRGRRWELQSDGTYQHVSMD